MPAPQAPQADNTELVGLLTQLLESSLRVEALLVAQYGQQQQNVGVGMPPSWRRRMAQDADIEMIDQILAGTTAAETAALIKEKSMPPQAGGPQ